MSAYGFRPDCPTCTGYQCNCYYPTAPQMPPPPPHHHHPPPHHHHGPPPHHHHGPPPHQSYSWMDGTTNGYTPPDAVQGGTDSDGHVIYVGRAYHEGDWIPAKVIPGKRAAYVPYGGGEHLKHSFQFLCGSNMFHWVPSNQGGVPPNAIQAGKTKEGETLYVGRVHQNGALTVGKIQPSHRVCYIPFNGKEQGFPHYEVLVFRH